MTSDILISVIRAGFLKIKDHRRDNACFSLADLLSTAFAMFSLKDPSLLHFRNEFANRSANLKRIYGIENIPQDTALREGIDHVHPDNIVQLFDLVLPLLEQHQVFEERQVLDGYNIIAIDGTGYYCSNKKSCPQCMVKNPKNGITQYYHQLLAAVAVHPKQATVFPIVSEAIIKQDGSTKNDCERNAAKRLIPSICKRLPSTKLIAVCDALYANGPFIGLLGEHDIRYIISIKEGYVLTQIGQLKEQNALRTVVWKTKGIQCKAQFINGLMLNGQHQDINVNFLEYTETDRKTKATKFYQTWITDVPVNRGNIQEMVNVGRSRWKVENETFNTLKNQGYHLEHNYGHGKKYLTTNFALLTMLAFLVDQVIQHLDKDFQKAWKQCKSKSALWEKVRQVFDLIPAISMNAIHRFIAREIKVDFPLLE